MTIDPRHLANLLAIATHGSFNRAAAALNLSQPALSKSIALLEHRLGVPVFDRTTRGSTLTAAGEILLRRARSLAMLISDAEAEVHMQAGGIEGPLRVGATPSVMLDLIPAVLAQVTAGRGACSISVVEGLDDHMMPALLRGEIDLLVGPVGGLRPPPDTVIEQILCDDPFLLAAGAAHRLADRPEITLAELADEAWVLPMPGSLFHRHVEGLFMAAGIAWPKDAIHTNSLALSEQLVLEGRRIMLMTWLQGMTPGGRGLKRITVPGAGTRHIGIRHRKETALPVLGEAVVAAAQDVVRRYREAS
jgi:DNA-binding transcriptional LysR family regulator